MLFHQPKFCMKCHKPKYFRIHYVLLDFCIYTGTYSYSTFNSSYIFYHQDYIHTCMMYVLLLFLIHLFVLSYQKHLNLNLLFCLEYILYWARVLQLPTHLCKLIANVW